MPLFKALRFAKDASTLLLSAYLLFELAHSAAQSDCNHFLWYGLDQCNLDFGNEIAYMYRCKERIEEDKDRFDDYDVYRFEWTNVGCLGEPSKQERIDTSITRDFQCNAKKNCDSEKITLLRYAGYSACESDPHFKQLMSVVSDRCVADSERFPYYYTLSCDNGVLQGYSDEQCSQQKSLSDEYYLENQCRFRSDNYFQQRMVCGSIPEQVGCRFYHDYRMEKCHNTLVNEEYTNNRYVFEKSVKYRCIDGVPWVQKWDHSRDCDGDYDYFFPVSVNFSEPWSCQGKKNCGSDDIKYEPSETTECSGLTDELKASVVNKKCLPTDFSGRVYEYHKCNGDSKKMDTTNFTNSNCDGGELVTWEYFSSLRDGCWAGGAQC